MVSDALTNGVGVFSLWHKDALGDLVFVNCYQSMVVDWKCSARFRCSDKQRALWVDMVHYQADPVTHPEIAEGLNVKISPVKTGRLQCYQVDAIGHVSSIMALLIWGAVYVSVD